MHADPSRLHIAVAIVSYRTADMVADALPPLLEELSRFASGRVVIVDNASPDGGAARLAERLAGMGNPEAVTLVASPDNGGFAKGNNLAFQTLRDQPGPLPDAVMLLNPDAVMRPDCLVDLARVLAENPKVGVAGAQLVNERGDRWQAAFNFPSAMGEFARELKLDLFLRRWPVLAPKMDAPGPVDWITGAAMLIRWEMIEAIGGMDETYFLYFEEVDYMLQARRAGWETWHVPAAAVTHFDGGSTGIVNGRPTKGRMPSYWLDSYNRYFAKNHGAGYMRLAASLKLVGLLLGDLQLSLRGRRLPRTPGLVGDILRSCVFGKSKG